MQWALIVAGVILAFMLTLRLMENAMIYFPVRYPEGFWEPREFGLPVEDCFFTTEDGVTLHGWWVHQPGTRQVLLWCHGNAGNLTHRLENIVMLRDEVKVNVLIFDYRGYGRSEGRPDEPGLYRDARAAYEFLISTKHVEPEQIILFGRSLGGAVAVDLACRRPVAGLILESTFTSAKEMARRVIPLLPVHLVLGVRFDSVEKIGKLYIPVLIIHGTADEVVPYELGRKLFAAANDPKEFYAIEGADHNNTYVIGGAAYFAKIRQFINRLSARQPH